MAPSTLIPVATAAELLGVSKASIYSYARRGVLIGGRAFTLTRYGSRLRRMFDLEEVMIIKEEFDRGES